jgi:hypothetical protein
MNKIFCIGSNKTGTTSLTKSLELLGYSVCPENIMFSQNSKYFIEQSIGSYESLFNLVLKYDAFEDRPWNHSDFYKILDKKFDKSKFILTDNEDAYKWFKKARHKGRDEIPYTQDNIKMIGWNMYMTPPDAADGLWLMSSMSKHNEDSIEDYPDLTKNDLFKKL